MTAHFTGNSDINNSFRNIRISPLFTASLTVAGLIDLLANAQHMDHNRAGAELMVVLLLGAISGYQYATKSLNQLFSEKNKPSAHEEF